VFWSRLWNKKDLDLSGNFQWIPSFRVNNCDDASNSTKNYMESKLSRCFTMLEQFIWIFMLAESQPNNFWTRGWGNCERKAVVKFCKKRFMLFWIFQRDFFGWLPINWRFSRSNLGSVQNWTTDHSISRRVVFPCVILLLHSFADRLHCI